MSGAKGKQTIIIKKVKKGGHGGHHGGSWKVAYADFVTAMMAFFLLLWLLAATPAENLKGLADYFSPTMGLKDRMGIGFRGGIAPAKEGASIDEWASRGVVFGAPPAGPTQRETDDRTTASSGDGGEADNAEDFTVVQTDIEKVISSSPELLTQKEHIKIEMLPEGLKIELIDTEGKPMFDPGSAEMKPILKALLAGVTEVIRYLPNYIVVEGHSNSIRNTGIKRTYGNWELSADRANAARRFMEDSGIDKDQVARVVAKGDNEPRNTENFLGAENRRIAIIILKRSVLPFHKKVAPDELMEEPNKENTAKYLTLVPAEEKAEAEPAQSTQGVTPLEKNLKTLPQLEAKEGEEKPVSQPLRTITSPTPRMEFSPAAAINADPSAALELPPPEEKKKIIRELPKME